VAVLAVAGLGVLSTPWAERYLERRAIAAIESATGTKVVVHSFDFHPLRLAFDLGGVEIRGVESAGGPALFSARRLTAQLRFRALLERQPLLARLDWEDAEIHILTHPDGSTNLPTLPAAAAGSAAEARIDQITLSNTRVFWNDQRLHLGLNASDLAVLVRSTAGGKYAGSISAAQVMIRGPKTQLPAVGFHAQADFSRAGLETQALSWQCAGIAGRGSATVTRWNPLEVRLSYRVEGPLPEIAQALGLGDIRQGNGSAEGTLAYEGGIVASQGRIALRQLEFATGRTKLRGASAAADYAMREGQVRVENLTGSALGGSFRGSGEILLKDPEPEYRFRTQAEGLSLRQLAEALGQGRTARYFASRVSGSIFADWKGRLRGFNSRYNLAFAPEEMKQSGMLAIGGTIEGGARMEPGFVLAIREAELHTRGSAVSARGSLSAHRTSLALGVSVADFEEWRPLVEPWVSATEPIPLKLHAAATFRGEMSGSLQALEWRGEIAGGAFEFQGTRWDKLSAGLTVTPQVVQVTDGRLERGTSQLRLETELPLQGGKLDPTRPLQLSLTAEKTRLDGLLAALGQDLPLAGSLTGKLQLQGSMDKAHGGGHLRLDYGTLYGEAFSSLSAHIAVERSIWQFRDIVLKKGAGKASGSGELDYPARQLSLRLAGRGFRVEEMRRLHAALDLPPSTLQGVWDFDVRGRGWTDATQLDGTLNLRNMVAGAAPIGDVTARWVSRAGRLEFSGQAQGPGGRVQFSGTQPGPPGAPIALTGEFAAFRIDPWLRLSAPHESMPPITASGTLRGRVLPDGLGFLDLSAQATQFSIEYPTLTMSAASPVNLRLAERRLSIDRFTLQGPATSLDVEGSVRFGQGGLLALQAEGKAEATLLSLLDPALQASGASLLKVRVSGSFARPAIHGTLTVQNVNAGYGDLPFRITGLTGEVLLEGDRATLRSLEGTSGGGRVVLNGNVDFGSVTRFNLQAGLAQVRVRYPSVFTSMLDGRLRLSTSADRGEISGDIILRQIFPPENFNWLAHVGQVGSGVEMGRTPLKSPIAPRIRLNISVQSSPAVRFQARDLRLVGDIDVRLQGTLADPVEVGHVQILSGEAVFRGNRYQIRRGDISMTNPFRTESTLTLEADTRIQRYNLTVNLSGPFHRLKITYRSDPPLPTSDIVTLLAFGYARQQEEMSTGSTHPAATVGASALLSQALSTQTSGRIQRLFGVSRIKIDPNAGGVATTGGALITVEQQVSPDLTITYATNTGVSQYRIIRMEWAVNERVSVIGERDQGGVFGMEVQFRQRFR
jgi:translocation and assembly module TamB